MNLVSHFRALREPSFGGWLSPTSQGLPSSLPRDLGAQRAVVCLSKPPKGGWMSLSFFFFEGFLFFGEDIISRYSPS